MLLAQRALNRPAALQASGEGCALHAKLLRPFGKAFALAVEFVLRSVFVWGSAPVAGLARWSGKSVFNAPAKSLDPLRNGCVAQARFFCPVHDRLRFAHVGQKHVALLVSVLRPLGCPVAIVRAVWAVVVDAVKRVIIAWPWSHVGQKSIKRIPAITNKYPASAVTVESWMGFAPASVSHVHPCPVFRRSGVLVFLSHNDLSRREGR